MNQKLCRFSLSCYHLLHGRDFFFKQFIKNMQYFSNKGGRLKIKFQVNEMTYHFVSLVFKKIEYNINLSGILKPEING